MIYLSTLGHAIHSDLHSQARQIFCIHFISISVLSEVCRRFFRIRWLLPAVCGNQYFCAANEDKSFNKIMLCTLNSLIPVVYNCLYSFCSLWKKDGRYTALYTTKLQTSVIELLEDQIAENSKNCFHFFWLKQYHLTDIQRIWLEYRCRGPFPIG